MSPIRRTLAFALGALLLAGYAEEASAQGAGAIRGRITETTGQPISGVQISISGTQRGTITDQTGAYLIPGVPVGAREVRIMHIGFRSETRNVNVVSGETITLDLQLQPAVLDMQEIVVTGVAGEQSRAKLPFSVPRLTEATMPVQAPNAAAMIVGKVAGALVAAPTGRPGSAPSILLRGPTSIQASGRSQDPLYIVDGVILSASLIDIDAMDVESIEIVKGAAAASLYGSRAANGVIQITTHRGKNVANDQVRYTVRTEYGQGQLHGRFNLTQKHHFRMTEDGRFVNAQGVACAWLECQSVSLAGQKALPGQPANTWNTLQQETWPGTTYDHMDRFFSSGASISNYVSIAGRSGGTNYLLGYNRLDEDGILPYHEGQVRHTFRLNVDQSMRNDLTVSGSAMYTRNRYQPNEGNMFQLTRMPAGVDLLSKDPRFDDSLILKPDPWNDNINPLIGMQSVRDMVTRGRFLGSVNARYTPFGWLNLDGNVSFDRADVGREQYQPKGVRNINGVPGVGSIWYTSNRIEGTNASAQAQVRRGFGELNTTTTVRYLVEQEDNRYHEVSSNQFLAEGVYTISNTPSTQRGGYSEKTPEKRDGFFVSSMLDFRDRYVLDALVRQDGSSRFGADARRRWYYRVSGKYRISEEPWFNIDQIDELGFRYSLGTAGNTPSWSAQYETYSVGASGITPATLGNRNLKPEFATEQEMGVDLNFLGRFAVDLTYARTEVKDQILNIPALAYTGFSSQWLNAGTLESNTFEATVTAQFRPRRNLTWTSRLLFDRTRQEITELNRPAYQTGVSGQGLETVFYVRAGEAIGTFYGVQVANQCSHLRAGQDCSQFQVNDDGHLVWVGGAGSWQNGWQTHNTVGGTTRTWWGTSSGMVDARGNPISWGTPFAGMGIDRVTGDSTAFLPLGSTTPKFNVGFANTITVGDFTLYGLLQSVQGYKVYNQPLQWATFQSYSGIMDQSGVPEDLKKPLGYYERLYGLSGLVPSSAFVDDASYIKLRELQLRYRAGRTMLDRLAITRGFEAISFSVTGSNLLTWSKYDGYDPDVGSTGGGTGSAAIARVDGFSYPPYRTVRFGVEVNF
jgi:TonB-linked SusC/RagA family outer membrane protein